MSEELENDLHPKEWKIDLYPWNCSEKLFKTHRGHYSFEAKYDIEQWQEGEYEDGRFNDFFQDKGIPHDLICLIFETDERTRLYEESTRELTKEETERLQELEEFLIYSEIKDEFQLKQAINEIYEIVPGKYVYVIFSTTDKIYIPIFINRENYWIRMDTFPIPDFLSRDKPFLSKGKPYVQKKKVFSIETIKKGYPEYDCQRVKITNELAGQATNYSITQGMRINIVIKGLELELKVEMLHFNQEQIVMDLFNSNLIAVRILTITDPSAEKIVFSFRLPFF